MLISHGETDIGKRRKINEDSIFAASGLFVVCDGMGGHKAGEVASRLAVETIARFVERTEEDRELTWPFGFNPQLSSTNRLRPRSSSPTGRLPQANSREEYTGMGTTLVAVIVSPDESRMTYAHVGDSRIYLLRDRTIVQLTRDDSWANLGWSGAPDEDPTTTTTGLMKNILTKALGARDDVEFDVVDQPLHDGDTVLLCSDGLTNMLPDARILEVVAAHSNDLPGACRQLVAEANAQGGRDNISVILVAYRR
jgi:protein phosphatase